MTAIAAPTPAPALILTTLASKPANGANFVKIDSAVGSALSAAVW